MKPQLTVTGLAACAMMLALLVFGPCRVVASPANEDMETFSNGVATSWTPFWVANGVDGTPQYLDSTSIRHRYSHAQGMDLTGIGTSSDPVLKCYAGVYQRVPATHGTVYTCSAWHYLDMATGSTNVCAFSVGIDPQGGTDPSAASIMWSQPAWNGSSAGNVLMWKQNIVSVSSASSQITIFLRVAIIPARIGTISPGRTFIDQVYLTESYDTSGLGTVANWSFESGFHQPDPLVSDAYPLSWAPFGAVYGSYGGAGIRMSSQTTGTPAEGSRCLELALGSGRTLDMGWGVYQRVAVTAGRQYDIYAQTKGSGGGQTRALGVDAAGSAGMYSPQTIWQYDSQDTNSWRTLHIGPVTATSGTMTVYVKSISTAIDGSRLAWFDAVELLQYGSETVPPAAVGDLSGINSGLGIVDLSWTCTGDDGYMGQASSQVVKYSTQTITEANWNSATNVIGEPAPAYRGSRQSMRISGLSTGATYYFAMKVYDESGNASPVSNVAQVLSAADTTPPVKVNNVSVGRVLSDAVELIWSAPGHLTFGGVVEPATTCELRYRTSAITGMNWNSSTPVTVQVAPMPASPGVSQSMWVRKLAPGTKYYFALRSADAVGNWSEVSNSPSGTTTAQGTAPYWAYHLKDKLNSWYNAKMAECQDADNDRSGDPSSWYFDSIDKDCEAQSGIAALLMIVRNQWLVDFLGRLSDHVWSLTDENTYWNWNESHHLGELTWNGVTMSAIDYDNPKWQERLVQYCSHFQHWTGYTGDATTGGPHLHFRSMWFKGDTWDHSQERGIQSLVDTPENRRLTRAPEYAAWKDPNALMPDGRRISDLLLDLDTASAEDCMKTDLNKPLGVWPAEIGFGTHRIGAFSGNWYRMAASLGGALGSSGEWWWDWGVGWVQARDAYYELVDRYVTTGDPKFIVPVRETLRYFSQTAAINNIPPMYMFINGDDWYHGPIAPWPDYNDPWGGYQCIINYLYRQYTGDTQFDAAWLGHANTLWQVMPRPGATRYQRMVRSTLTWTTDNPVQINAHNPFFIAWKVTGDKEWLCRSLDEMKPGDQFHVTWTQAMYNGVPSVYVNRLPDQPISWQNTNSNFAALVLDWDNTHVKWLTYNFDAANKPVQILLWSLKPGSYIIRHGPDANLDDQMDSVAESTPFVYVGRRTQLNITLPANRMEVFEIVPLDATTAQARALPDGSPLALSGAVVTGVFDGFFYVGGQDRLNGIRVDCLTPVSAGDAVTLSGYAAENSGERCVKAVTASVVSHGNQLPKPLGMSLRALGGAQRGLQQGVADDYGPGNIGTLVRTWGKVVEVGSGHFLVDDGSGCSVKCLLAGSGYKVCANDRVAVTGISSCEIQGGQLRRLLRLRSVTDVQIL